MQFLRNFSIFQRLLMILGVVTLGLILLSLSSLPQQFSSLEQQQYEKTKNLVEDTFGIIEHFYNLQKDGIEGLIDKIEKELSKFGIDLDKHEEQEE